MSEPAGPPIPYRVSYSERVRQAMLELIARARTRGLGRQVLGAIRTIDQRLRVYPQFGEPLHDLQLEPGQIWIGTIPPLTVRYVLDEERRLVMVVVPLAPLPGSGLEP